MSELFDPLFGMTAVAAAGSDTAWVQALCRVESALAVACASVGLADDHDAAAVAAACADPPPAAELGARAVADGNPVIPLVATLRSRLSGAPAALLHRGATSQDVLDTAWMLVGRAAVGLVVADLRAAAGACAALARRHRDTPMAARTLLQQALPTTFGAVAAGWGRALLRASAGLSSLEFAVQYGGAAGTLASVAPNGPAVRAALAAELGLADPGGPWHVERSRIQAVGTALGVACAAIAKVAGDVVLLAQTELGEVHEGAGGTSSTLPHKRNPVAAVTARAAAMQAPGLVSTLLAATPELQRGAGPWHAEWPALTGLLRAAGGAGARLRCCLDGLSADPSAMARNLGITNGLLMAERVSSALTPALGRAEAQRAVTAAAAGDLRDALSGYDLDPAVLLDPAGYLGESDRIVASFLAEFDALDRT